MPVTLSGNVGGGQGTGAQPPAPQGGTQTQNPTPTTQPTEEYKTLQRDLQKEKDRNARLAAQLTQYQGDLTAEEKLSAAETRIAEMEREVQMGKILRDASPEVRELIEKFVEKFGQVPDDEYVALLTSKVTRESAPAQGTQQQTPPAPQENSGLRNAPLQQAPTRDQEVDDFLKTVRMDDLR